MDLQSIFNFAGGIITGFFGWVIKEMYALIKTQERELSQFKQDVPKEYVAKNDFKDTMREVREMFSHIMNKLDDKQDKQ